MNGQNRESLSLETNENLSFNRKKGCFLSSTTVVVLVVLFISAVIGTGLLVYFASGKSSKDSNEELKYDLINKAYTQESNDETSMKNDKKEEDKKKKKKVMDVRLPRSIKPLHYHVKLIPYINGNFSINGFVEMTFEAVEDTQNVTMHIRDIVTKNETVKVQTLWGKDYKISKHIYDKDREFYIAILDKSIKSGMKCKIQMEFIGHLYGNLVGFYNSSYEDENGNKRRLAATQFQPTDARRAFPCLDEPALKANFTIELGRQTNMTSISNMPLKNSIPMEGHRDWMWDQFEDSVAMSTYLVAFAVSDFAMKKSVDNNAYDFRVWARKGAINQAEYALEIGPKISKHFENYYQVPFPLPKQDMIALPDFSAGAMENWGLITYRETAMLYDPLISTIKDKTYVGLVIAHELAHQWFGNLVTPSWWTDLWLNEGFASYMEYVGLNSVEPTFKIMEQFLRFDLHRAFKLDCLESSHKIYIKVNHPDEITEIFDTISYSKGASIIRMMNHFLGEKTFTKGLSHYLKALAYSGAEQNDLWRHLTIQAHKDGSLPSDMSVQSIMDTWTLQMGYPVITVTRNNDGTAMLEQKRFLLVENKNSTDKHDYKWWVPITYASENNPDFSNTKPKEWMRPNEAKKVISGVPNDKWIIFNVQQTGYYIVNYDQKNWDAIAEQLFRDHTVISTVNRAQIIFDSLTLARAGMLPYDTVMNILSYLKNEDDFIPWSTALSELGFIKSMFAHTGGYGALKEFLLSLTLPMFNKLGFEDNVQDPYQEQIKRADFVEQVCNLGYKPCIDKAVSYFNLWMQNPQNYSTVPANLKDTVYCTAIEAGGYDEWKYLWGRFKKADVAAEKRTIMYAMGCTKESWILKGYLQRSLIEGKGIRKQDISTVLRSVSITDHGKLIGWEFLRDQYETYYKKFGEVSFTLGGILKSAMGSLNTRNNIRELEDFFTLNKDKLGTGEMAFKQAFENVKNNVNWMDTHYNTILDWLTKNGYVNSI